MPKINPIDKSSRYHDRLPVGMKIEKGDAVWNYALQTFVEAGSLVDYEVHPGMFVTRYKTAIEENMIEFNDMVRKMAMENVPSGYRVLNKSEVIRHDDLIWCALEQRYSDKYKELDGQMVIELCVIRKAQVEEPAERPTPDNYGGW